MIRSLSVDEKKLELRNAVDESSNIFDIDSISLLIGENGTGKTHFLSQVINEFKSSHIGAFTGGCEIDFFNIPRQDVKNESRYWGVVYFSPIPFRERYSPSKNFIDASPVFGRGIKLSNLNESKEILEYFNIKPASRIEYKFNTKMIIKSILDEVFKLSDRRIKKILQRHSIFNELIHLEKLTREMSNENEDPDNTKNYSSILNKRRSIFGALIQELYLSLTSIENPIEITSSLITINGLKKKNKIKNSSAINILNYFLNGAENLNRHEMKSLEEFEKERKKVESFLKFINSNFTFTEYMTFPVDAYEGEKLLSDYEVEDYFEFKLIEMSSGQLAVIHQMGLISKAINQLAEKNISKILLMIDEGDAYLHLEWQRNYILKVNDFLRKVKAINNISVLQVILATHSPLLATDIPKNFICPMDKTEATSGFASPIHLLLNESFGTKTIGEFASQRINKTVINIKQKKASKKDYLVIQSIDNDILEREIMKLLPLNGDLK
ncbi:MULTISPECIES: AAA family ATPase [Enterobacter cloacae complex]|uniref:AAA family ATPase n=1 Tax=Enterobacter cloacae complex TaxID=354276 RepID=UPI000D0BCD0E|nr:MULTISPECIES: AAA family ATPase [Enterobacter cloacae complex]AVP02526.1 hypothetical protein AM379_19845 [Enterobacter cloacae complex sp. FDA-CDC-AR_0132]MBQ0225023.1 ATP-binding protein [Enterobacter ludwigii]MED5696156.1 AAA family ATPase [Enterobacter ludwigii]